MEVRKGDDQSLDQLQLNRKRWKSQNPDSNSDQVPIFDDSRSNPSPIKYKECQKNHAASTGGYIIDGCGEFMPAGEEDTTEAMKCAACECHRNFHRKEVFGQYPFHNSPNKIGPSNPGPVIMTFAGAGAKAESSSQDIYMFKLNGGGTEADLRTLLQQPPAKKRFRTKLSKEQKNKMVGFAEKLEWKIGKQEENGVEKFCSEIGIKRKVFKVWMHNNKQAMKRKQQ